MLLQVKWFELETCTSLDSSCLIFIINYNRSDEIWIRDHLVKIILFYSPTKYDLKYN